VSQRRVVIAPDSFKGTATAIEVAESIASGWLEVHPGDEVRCMPMADGGEGALDAFAIARPDARRMPVTVTGPDGRDVEAYWLLLPATDAGAANSDTSSGTVGVVELASTSGITLLDPLRPLDAHTLGFGQAIRSALDAGVDRLVLAIGGSSSSDGGAGVLQALGARLLDASGAAIVPGNAGLADVASVDFAELAPLPPLGVTVLSDVTNPLLGRGGAVAVFGPQKGVTDALAPAAEAALTRWAWLVADARTIDPTAPGTGAAGGVGFGLLAWGAELTPGSSAVGAEVGLPAVIAGADVVVTGEGRYDHQSEAGKVPSYVRGLARAAGARTALVAGAVQADPGEFDAAESLTELAGGAEAAMAEPLVWLREAGRRFAARL
jgi:glycerate kinase